MKYWLFIIGLVLLSSFVVAQASVDVSVACPDNECRIDEPFFMFYNITLPTQECCGGLGLEHVNGTRYFCAFEDRVDIPGGSISFINQVCSMYLPETGKYLIFKGESQVISYIGQVRITHALPNAWTIALLILSVAFFLLGALWYGILIIPAILAFIGGLTGLIFTYSYILSPILIGVISIIYILLLVLLFEIFKRLF